MSNQGHRVAKIFEFSMLDLIGNLLLLGFASACAAVAVQFIAVLNGVYGFQPRETAPIVVVGFLGLLPGLAVSFMTSNTIGRPTDLETLTGSWMGAIGGVFTGFVWILVTAQLGLRGHRRLVAFAAYLLLGLLGLAVLIYSLEK